MNEEKFEKMECNEFANFENRDFRNLDIRNKSLVSNSMTEKNHYNPFKKSASVLVEDASSDVFKSDGYEYYNPEISSENEAKSNITNDKEDVKSSVETADYDQLSQKKDLTKKLPLEIFEKILSYLDDIDVERAVCVNRYWKMASIDAENHKQFFKIKDFFLDFLYKNIEEESIKKEIKELFSDKNPGILNSSNLIELNLSISEYRKIALNILKNLNKDDLKKLEESFKNRPKPKFFEDVFYFAGILKEIDEIKIEFEDRYVRSCKIRNLSINLSNKGKFKEAEEVANKIDDGISKDAALREIAEALAKNGRTKEAIRVITTMHTVASKNAACRNISIILVEKDEVNKAMQFADMTSYNEYKKSVYKKIYNTLMRENKFKEAEEVLSMLSNFIK